MLPARVVAPSLSRPPVCRLAGEAPPWRSLSIDWQDTQLGPGFPDTIPSAWSDVGVLVAGDVLRIEAEGFNGQDSKITGWGWYLNIWSGNGRNWVGLRGSNEPSRLLHFNPRPRGGAYIAMNNFLKGVGWGKEKDLPVPLAWKLEKAATPFVLDIELGDGVWNFKVNDEPQPDLAYVRKGDFSEPLILQLYDLLNPRVSLKQGGTKSAMVR
jgi:hypothetical protein